MLVHSAASEVRNAVRRQRRAGYSVGVVPTMGALHAGHVSLIEAARRKSDFVVATIFVNPTQFGPHEDFDKYPRTLDADLDKCRLAGADLVFTPEVSAMYEGDAETIVRVTKTTQVLEGEKRPEHFQGVTTIVAKLFHITEPDQAYFGQKDYQQQLVIRRMVRDLDWGIQIVTCPIIREADGLAMSSRNRYLSADDRQRALVLSQSLQRAAALAEEDRSPAEIEAEMQARISSVPGVVLDYAVVRDAETLLTPAAGCPQAVALGAARVGDTRLVDNQILRVR